MESRFGKELHTLMVWYTEKNIKVTAASNKKIITKNIDLSLFVSLLPGTK